MRTLNFLKEEFTKNKRIFILLFAECFFTFLIVGFCVPFLLDSYTTLKVIGGMNQSENLYYLINNSESKSYNGSFKTEEWNELYHFITENYDYIMTTDELLPIDDAFTWPNGMVDNAIGISYCTDSYKLINPNVFADYDFDSYKGDYVPIILGYGYKPYYKVGDVINSTWEVAAFTEEGSIAIPMGTTYLLSGNSSNICTHIKYYPSDFYDRSHIEVCIYALSNKELFPLFDKMNELGLDSIVPISFKDKISFMIDEFYKTLSSYLFIAGGVMLFSILCTSSGFISYMRLRKRDYLIYEMCGASVYSIAAKLAILNFTVIMLPAVICMLIFHRADLIPVFLALGAAIEVCSLAKPLYGLLKKPLIEQYCENR